MPWSKDCSNWSHLTPFFYVVALGGIAERSLMHGSIGWTRIVSRCFRTFRMPLLLGCCRTKLSWHACCNEGFSRSEHSDAWIWVSKTNGTLCIFYFFSGEFRSLIGVGCSLKYVNAVLLKERSQWGRSRWNWSWLLSGTWAPTEFGRWINNPGF